MALRGVSAAPPVLWGAVMGFDVGKHHRRSIRLANYDYAGTGACFVTICTHQAEVLFGEITDGAMVLNEFGQIAHEEWLASESIRQEIADYKLRNRLQPPQSNAVSG